MVRYFSPKKTCLEIRVDKTKPRQMLESERNFSQPFIVVVPKPAMRLSPFKTILERQIILEITTL